MILFNVFIRLFASHKLNAVASTPYSLWTTVFQSTPCEEVYIELA